MRIFFTFVLVSPVSLPAVELVRLALLGGLPAPEPRLLGAEARARAASVVLQAALREVALGALALHVVQVDDVAGVAVAAQDLVGAEVEAKLPGGKGRTRTCSLK